MQFLRHFIRFSDAVNEKVGMAAAWMTTLLVITVCFDVFTRYFLRESMVAVQELEWHLFAFIFLLAAGFTLKYDRHVRVDVLYIRLNDRQKAWINLLGSLIFLIPLCIIIIISSKNYVFNAWMIGESSPDPGGLPARYILKAAIPIAFIFLLLQAISLLFKSILTLATPPTEQENPHA